MVVAVSTSRLMLGVHYPRDVTGGVVVGVAAASLSYVAVRRLDTRGLTLIAVAVGSLGLVLHLVGVGALEPPSVLVGVALGELLCSRFKLVERPGWAYGAIGSILALALGVPALRVKDEIPLLSIALLVLAGSLAVIAPRVSRRILGGRGEEASSG
jgi:hypothetical protein